MVAIGRRRSFSFLAGALLATQVRADDSADVHAVVGSVAEALSSGETTEAMRSFSKSYPDYEKLSSYFDGLVGAYFVESQVDFTDEETSSNTAIVKLRWALTLATRQTGFTKNRTAELTLKFAREGKNWRIVDLTPIDMFNPAQ